MEADSPRGRKWGVSWENGWKEIGGTRRRSPCREVPSPLKWERRHPAQNLRSQRVGKPGSEEESRVQEGRTWRRMKGSESAQRDRAVTGVRDRQLPSI